MTEGFSVGVPLACCARFARFKLHSSDGMILGFQVRQCGRSFLAAGGVLCAERQPDTACVSLEHGRAGCGVGIWTEAGTKRSDI